MPELVASTKTYIFASAFASVHQDVRTWMFASGAHVALSKSQHLKHEHVSSNLLILISVYLSSVTVML